MKYGFFQAEVENGLKFDVWFVYFVFYWEDFEWIVVGFNWVDLQLVSMFEKDVIVVFVEYELFWKYFDVF